MARSVHYFTLAVILNAPDGKTTMYTTNGTDTTNQISEARALPEEFLSLVNPWLVAVWPGMGNVGIGAGYYLMSNLGMSPFAEFSPGELFDVEHVDVQAGILTPADLPRSRCFLWRDPKQKHDIVLFVGEAQPLAGKRQFCQALIQLAKRIGIQKVLTFAAMATPMHPEKISRVFCAATDQATLDEMKQLGVKPLTEGRISGLNGVVLAEAARQGISGICLLGEMPQVFAQLPFPGGSLAVLKVFSTMAGISIDLEELVEQADDMGTKLTDVINQVQGSLEAQTQPQASKEPSEESPEFPEFNLEEEAIADPEPDTSLEEPMITSDETDGIEELFNQAQLDHSKTVELKRELDRLDVFDDYEDRFLDLFKGPSS